jgi:hypothetical protein
VFDQIYIDSVLYGMSSNTTLPPASSRGLRFATLYNSLKDSNSLIPDITGEIADQFLDAYPVPKRIGGVVDLADPDLQRAAARFDMSLKTAGKTLTALTSTIGLDR